MDKEHILFYLDSLDNDELIETIKKMIIDFLKVDEYDIKYILDDIKKPCEYVTVYFALTSHKLLYGNKQHGDASRLYQEKEKVSIRKKRIIEDLGYLRGYSTLTNFNEIDAMINEINSAELDMRVYTIRHKEPSLKAAKKNLENDLLTECKTGKVRAKSIKSILNFIPN